jgi:hypothetical protein
MQGRVLGELSAGRHRTARPVSNTANCARHETTRPMPYSATEAEQAEQRFRRLGYLD